MHCVCVAPATLFTQLAPSAANIIINTNSSSRPASVIIIIYPKRKYIFPRPTRKTAQKESGKVIRQAPNEITRPPPHVFLFFQQQLESLSQS